MHLLTDQSETAASLEELSERLGPHIGKTIRLDNPAIPDAICPGRSIASMVMYGTLRWFRFRPNAQAIRLNMDRSFDIFEGEKSDFLWLDSTLSVLMDGSWRVIHRPEGARHNES